MAYTYKLVYISQAREDISYRDIEDILKKSRNNNVTHNVTGLLIFTDGFFIQYLEADSEATLKIILAKIVQDTRHSKLRILNEWPCEGRAFRDWAMGFMDFDLAEKSHPFIQKIFGDCMLATVPSNKEFVNFFQEFVRSEPLLK